MIKKLFGLGKKANEIEEVFPINEGETKASVVDSGEQTLSTALINALKDHANAYGDSKIYTAEIPVKKLNNVKSIYKLSSIEDIEILYDSTLFGSGKDGYIVTDSFFGVKAAFEDAHKISFTEICQSNATERTSTLRFKDKEIRIDNAAIDFLDGAKKILIEGDERFKSCYVEEIQSNINTVQELLADESYAQALKYVRLSISKVLLGDNLVEPLYKAQFNAHLQLNEYEEAKEVLALISPLNQATYAQLQTIYDEQYKVYVESLIEQEIQEYEQFMVEQNYMSAYSQIEKIQQLTELTNTEKYDEQLKEFAKVTGYYILQQMIDSEVQAHRYDQAIQYTHDHRTLQYLSEEEIVKQIAQIQKQKEIYIDEQYQAFEAALEVADIAQAKAVLKLLQNVNEEADYTKELIKLNIIQEKFDEAKTQLATLGEQDRQELEKMIENVQHIKLQKIRNALKTNDFKYFMNNTVDANVQDEFGMTAIMHAITQEDKSAFKALLPYSDLTIETHTGHTLDDFLHIPIYTANYLYAYDSNYSKTVDASKKVHFMERVVKFVDKNAKPTINTDIESYIDTKEKMGDYISDREQERRQQAYQAERYVTERYVESFLSFHKKIYGYLSEDQEKILMEQLAKVEQELVSVAAELSNNPLADTSKVEEAIAKFINENRAEFIQELTLEIRGEKSEFETTAAYEERLKTIEAEVLTTHVGVVADWEAQSRNLVIEQLQENQQNAQKIYQSLTSIKQYLIEKQLFAKKMKEDPAFQQAYFESLNSGDKDDFTLDKYDADNEVFSVIYGGSSKVLLKLNVPLAVAQKFKESFEELTFYVRYEKQGDHLVKIAVFKMDGKNYELPYETEDFSED